jgi:hypothetical protein
MLIFRPSSGCSQLLLRVSFLFILKAISVCVCVCVCVCGLCMCVCVCVCGGTEFAKQVLYHLSNSSSPFCFSYFGARVSRTICLGWPGTVILLISTSQVARITGVSHWHPAVCLLYNMKHCLFFMFAAFSWQIFSMYQFVGPSVLFNTWEACFQLLAPLV